MLTFISSFMKKSGASTESPGSPHRVVERKARENFCGFLSAQSIAECQQQCGPVPYQLSEFDKVVEQVRAKVALLPPSPITVAASAFFPPSTTVPVSGFSGYMPQLGYYDVPPAASSAVVVYHEVSIAVVEPMEMEWSPACLEQFEPLPLQSSDMQMAFQQSLPLVHYAPEVPVLQVASEMDWESSVVSLPASIPHVHSVSTVVDDMCCEMDMPVEDNAAPLDLVQQQALPETVANDDDDDFEAEFAKSVDPPSPPSSSPKLSEFLEASDDDFEKEFYAAGPPVAPKMDSSASVMQVHGAPAVYVSPSAEDLVAEEALVASLLEDEDEEDALADTAANVSAAPVPAPVPALSDSESDEEESEEEFNARVDALQARMINAAPVVVNGQAPIFVGLAPTMNGALFNAPAVRIVRKVAGLPRRRR